MSRPYAMTIGLTRRNEEMSCYWITPLYIRQLGAADKHGQFICDVQSYTPTKSASRAAGLGQLIISMLNNPDPPHCGDIISFVQLFELSRDA